MSIPCNKLPQCGKEFGQGGPMNKHMRSQHTSNDEKKYRCGTCGKGFNNNASLQDHKNVHTGEKPYKCKYCSACFASKGNQRMHERGHEGYHRNK